jgi:hypothetical protein
VREYFTFLRDAEADVEVVLGDGRIMLERELAGATSRPRFDVLIIDAFSGDAVPVHLLTLESLELYQRALAPGGVLVLQITNRHVDLERVVRGLAHAAGAGSSSGPSAVRRQWRHSQRLDVARGRGSTGSGRRGRDGPYRRRLGSLDGRLQQPDRGPPLSHPDRGPIDPSSPSQRRMIFTFPRAFTPTIGPVQTSPVRSMTGPARSTAARPGTT